MSDLPQTQASTVGSLRLTGPDGIDRMLTAPSVIGRGESADVHVEDSHASRSHLRLEIDAHSWIVRDLGSSNGTYLDGEPVQVARLDVGRTHALRLGGDGPTFHATVTAPVRAAAPAPAHAPFSPDATARRDDSASITVGRDRTCQLVIPDPLMSRRHFRIDRVRGQITDIESANGTYLDSVPITGPTPLRPGAVITAGNTSLFWDGETLQTLSPEADLIVEDLTVVAGGRTLLDAIEFALPPRSLTAVIGPSGAGKSTLLSTLTGTRTPDAGRVVWQGRDLHADHAHLRSQIGLVPQQDIQHDQLTVRKALGFSAELRLPPDTTRAERAKRIDEVVAQLQLTQQLDLRIGKSLSGGQKKRVSIATELLTAPPLLFLDEPTSGLDPALDHEVMEQLRSLADHGHTVLTVTHSVQALEICDNVLVLAPGGRVAYFGGPEGLLTHFGVSNYRDVFRRLAEGNVPTHRTSTAFRATTAAQAPKRTVSPVRQFSTLARRTIAVAASDRLFLGLLFLMPLLLGLLAHLVQGGHGFDVTPPGPPGGAPLPPSPEYGQRLSILVIGSCLMGLALTIRELVGERAVLLREYGVGESLAAYWLAKVTVFATLGLAQGTAFVAIASIGIHGPHGHGVADLGVGGILIPIALCTSAMTVIGLMLSALVRTAEQTMPALVLTVMVQLILSSTLISVAGRPVLAQLAWLSPSRWGAAGAASSMDFNLTKIAGQVPDRLFRHSVSTWSFDVIAVIGLGIIATLIGYLVVRVTTMRRA